VVFRSFVLLIHKARKWLSTLKFCMLIMLDINQGCLLLLETKKKLYNT
jgi:hypothetical protein